MYKKYFCLTNSPFLNTPDPVFLYESKSHKETLASMAYGVLEGKGFVVVSGDVGSGKTLLIQALKRELGDQHILIEIANPWVDPETVQAAVMARIGLDRPGDAALWDGFKQRLVELAGEGRRVILIIDEAHQLPLRTLESLCALSNLETATQKLIQIVLVGQNELSALLGEHSLRQLYQRITLRSCLQRLSAEETAAYIQHRLRVAGGSPLLFPAECIDLIHRESHGTPRIINNLCDKCLLFAFGRSSPQVTLQITRDAINSLWPERRGNSGAISEAMAQTMSMPEPAASARGGDASRLSFTAPTEIPVARIENDSVAEIPFSAVVPDVLEGYKEPSARRLRLPGAGVALIILLIAVQFAGFVHQSLQKTPQGVGFETNTKPPSSPVLPQNNVQEQAPASTPATDTSAKYLSPVSKEGSASTTRSESAVSVPTVAPPPLPGISPYPLKLREEKTSAKNTVSVLATLHYGAWNEAVRDLLSAANPDLSRLDRVPPGTRIRLPVLSRESLVVKDGQGRFFVYFASFDKAEFARMNQETIKRSFSGAELVVAERQGAQVHRLFVGPFVSQGEAQAVANSLWFKYLPILN